MHNAQSIQTGFGDLPKKWNIPIFKRITILHRSLVLRTCYMLHLKVDLIFIYLKHLRIRNQGFYWMILEKNIVLGCDGTVSEYRSVWWCNSQAWIETSENSPMNYLLTSFQLVAIATPIWVHRRQVIWLHILQRIHWTKPQKMRKAFNCCF